MEEAVCSHCQRPLGNVFLEREKMGRGWNCEEVVI